jgi:uncharacterized protein
MAAPFLLIDGYNLMHACGMCRRRYGVGEFEKHRNRFLRYLASHLSEPERVRTTVVFDAQNARESYSDRSRFEGMEILFSTGGDADTLIEEIILGHSSPRQIVLVSSDHRLQKAARKRRARSVDSEIFSDEFERHGPVKDSQEETAPPKTSHPKYSGDVTEKEMKSWMEVFGEIPEDKPPMPETEEKPSMPERDIPGDINDPDFWKIDPKSLSD